MLGINLNIFLQVTKLGAYLSKHFFLSNKNLETMLQNYHIQVTMFRGDISKSNSKLDNKTLTCIWKIILFMHAQHVRTIV